MDTTYLYLFAVFSSFFTIFILSIYMHIADTCSVIGYFKAISKLQVMTNILTLYNFCVVTKTIVSLLNQFFIYYIIHIAPMLPELLILLYFWNLSIYKNIFNNLVLLIYFLTFFATIFLFLVLSKTF